MGLAGLDLMVEIPRQNPFPDGISSVLLLVVYFSEPVLLHNQTADEHGPKCSICDGGS